MIEKDWSDVETVNQLKAEIIELRHALECVVTYWNEWKDAPDGDPTALSLFEVVLIAESTLNGKK